MYIQTIKDLIESKGYTINSMSKELNMSHVGLYKGLKNNTIKVETLLKIAEILGVSPCYFFGIEEKQEQEAKFDYLKNEVLGNGSISFDVYNYLEKEVASKVSISKEFIKLLNESFSNEEQKGILSGGIPDKKRFEDYKQGFNVWLLSNIRDALITKGVPALIEAYFSEIKACFMQIVSLAMKDERLIFLHKEGLIGSKELLSFLASHISYTLELKIDTPVIKLLEAYFSPNDIYDTLGHLISKRK
jgi:transcriptional regulator with XRE-family HTH domain